MEQDREETSRLFIAVPLPETIKARLVQIQEHLRALLPGAPIKWTNSEQFHLTLKFLGAVHARKIEALVASLQELTQRFRPLSLCATRLGCFPNQRSPRVIWAGIDDSTGQLLDLHNAIEDLAPTCSNEPRETRFSGHVTLARVRQVNRHETDLLRLELAKHEQTTFGGWTANEIELVRSELSSQGQGAKHSVVAAAAFKGS